MVGGEKFGGGGLNAAAGEVGCTGKRVKEVIQSLCKWEGIDVGEIWMGSRRGKMGRVRSKLAWKLVSDIGISPAEAAPQLGVSTSAISKALSRKVEANKSK